MASCTIIQISDLHIWHDVLGGGWIPQGHGHDPRIVDGLFSALSRYRRNPPDAIVMTGDASARGSTRQLAQYQQLRDQGWSWDPLVQYPGFASAALACADFPGNHDYWAGILLNPRIDVARVRPYFRDAWPIHLALDKHEIVLHGLCTTAGATPREQVLAVGRTRLSDILRLVRQLDVSTRAVELERRIPHHVLAVHHTTLAGSAGAHGLADVTVRTLSRLGARGVRGLLAGHDHGFDFGRGRAGLLEARCPTTTQGNRIRPQRQGFLVHTFSELGAGVHWRAQVMLWTGATFVPGLGISHPLWRPAPRHGP